MMVALWASSWLVPAPMTMQALPRTRGLRRLAWQLLPTCKAPTVTCALPSQESQASSVTQPSPPSSQVREVIRITGHLDTVVVPNRANQHRHHSTAAATATTTSLTPSSPPQVTRENSSQDTGMSSTHLSHIGRSHALLLPSAAPITHPMTEQQLEQLVAVIESSPRVVVITGAGCSTEAGIPDYRGPHGAYTKHGFKPMTHQQFMAGAAQRARYFARSFFGWHEFASSQPGGAHQGLARLVQNGWVQHIITQNVDRLHHKAGTLRDRVLELHGTTHEVRCLSCNQVTSRHDLQHTLGQLNPAAADMASQLAKKAADAAAAQQQPQPQPAPVTLTQYEDDQHQVLERTRPSTQALATPAQLIPVRRPDGDLELQDAGQGFIVPPCSNCGGVLKPEVVFFGDNIPLARVRESIDLAASANLLLVVGSSLMVYSAYRLVEACKKAGGRVVLVNVGTTRADAVADIKLEVLAGEAMMRAATHPRLLLPRVCT